MTKRIYASVCLDVEVYDPDQLKSAAADRAIEEGMSLEDWEDIRGGPSDDLRMLLDPGLVPKAGFRISDSSCEVSQFQGD